MGQTCQSAASSRWAPNVLKAVTWPLAPSNVLKCVPGGGGKSFIKCKKCGGWRKMYTPCESPCEFGKGWVAPTKAEEDKALRVFMEKQAKRQAASAKIIAKQQMREDRDKRAKSRADARVLAEAKAKKPKIMRELEGMSVMKPRESWVK